jgi:hypothetical protein
LYGQLYRDYALNGTKYSSYEIAEAIKDTYYARRGADKKMNPGHVEKRNRENDYGYDFGFYYADGLLYYAEVRVDPNATILVQLYYWEGELIACRDRRGGDMTLYFAGDAIFESAKSEFSYVFGLGPAV